MQGIFYFRYFTLRLLLIENISYILKKKLFFIISLIITISLFESKDLIAQTSWNSRPIADFRFRGEGTSPCSIVYTFIDSSKLLMPCNLNMDSCDSIVDYLWDFGFGFYSKQKNPSFKFPYFGDYFIKYKVTSAYGNSDSTVQIFRVNGPVPKFVIHSDTIIKAGEVVEFENTSTYSFPFVDPKWKWDFGDGFLLNENNIKNLVSHQYKTPGNYEVFLNMSASQSSHICYSIYPDPNGIYNKKIRITVKETTNNEKLVKRLLTIFPNPSSQFINFSDNIKGQITFYDLTGNMVLETNLLTNNSVNISNLQQGVYFVCVNHDSRIFFIKFLKI